VLVTQTAFASTLSYLAGRGLNVLPVPPSETGAAQTYNQLWERVPGAHGLLAFPGDVLDAQLLAEAGPGLCAIAVAGERCAPGGKGTQSNPL
jgi:hypothetical protein